MALKWLGVRALDENAKAKRRSLRAMAHRNSHRGPAASRANNLSSAYS